MLSPQLSCNKLNLYRSDGTKTSESGCLAMIGIGQGGGAGGGHPGGGQGGGVLRTICVPGERRLKMITIERKTDRQSLDRSGRHRLVYLPAELVLKLIDILPRYRQYRKDKPGLM